MRIVLILLFGIFPITAIIFHIWTTVIAFSEGGFWGGILTFIIPFISEIYWMVKMWGENDAYTTIGIIHLIGALLWTLFGGNNRR
jgi:hypothetical protein